MKILARLIAGFYFAAALSLVVLSVVEAAQITVVGGGAPTTAPYYLSSTNAALPNAVVPAADVTTFLGSADNAAMRTNLGLVIGTNVQAFDTDLTTYAGITPSANMVTFLGSGSFAAMRTNLTLTIGTNVQAFDTDLTTWAGVTPGTGVATALAVNVGSAGAPVLFNGAGGTPSSLTGTNITGIPPAGVTGTAAILGANSFTSTQTIAPATEVSPVVLTGGTLAGTTSRPLIDATQTWNNSGLTATGIKLNVTDTSSNAASLLLDLQVGAAAKFSVRKDGRIVTTGANFLTLGTDPQISQSNSGRPLDLVTTAAGGYVTIVNSTSGGLAFSTTTSNTSPDLKLTRAGAATLQMGGPDAASPVAQTTRVQNVVTGTSNTAGADWSLSGSQGTGTGAGGSILFKTAPAGSTGTAQNALATAFTVQQYGPQLPAAVTVANLPACAAGLAGVMRAVSDATAWVTATAPTGGGSVYSPVICNGTAWVAF